jgi:ABC-type lipoprotein release transport system permease subunit
MPVGKIIALAGTCGALLGFVAGFRVAEQIYVTDREKEMFHKRFRVMTSLTVAVAAVTVIATTLASTARV